MNKSTKGNLRNSTLELLNYRTSRKVFRSEEDLMIYLILFIKVKLPSFGPRIVNSERNP